MTLYSFPRAAVTKHHRLGGLQQQKGAAPRVWRPEVQSQGVSGAVLPLMCRGGGVAFLASCSLRCLGTIFSVPLLARSHGAPVSVSLITCLCLFSPEDASRVGPHLTLTNYICNVLLPNKITFKGTGVKASYLLRGRHSSTRNRPGKPLPAPHSSECLGLNVRGAHVVHPQQSLPSYNQPTSH